MIFYSSNQQLHEELMLQRMETTSLRTVLNKECKDESSQGSFCSVSASSSSSPISLAPGSTTSVLPPVPLGTPISILDFAQLSPSQQKLWMEGNKKKNKNTPWRHHQTKAAGCTIINTKGGGDSSASLNSTTSAGSCCSSTTIKSEETLRSLSSGCSTEENEDTGQSYSRRTTSSVGSQLNKSSSAQRSIFAPYWAKTGGKTMLLQRVHESRGVPVVVHGTEDSQTNNKEENFLRETSSNKMAMDYHHEMIKNEQAVRLPPPPSCTSTGASTGSNSSSNTPDGGSSPPSPPRRSIFGLETRSPQPRNHKKSICEIPPTLVPRFLHLPEQIPTLLSTNHKKARSTSALLDPPKESILKGEDGDDGPHPRRPRSHSFSVTFDSKVDVVLFHDPPAPYQSSPWWLRLVGGGGGGGNFDFSSSRNCHEQEQDETNKAPQQWRGGPRRVQSQRCSTTTTAIRNCHKSNTANRRLLPCDSF